MKLVIGGSTGFLATELIRQALSNPAFTSIIGLSRRETSVPAGFVDEEGKLKSVVVDDFSSYSETTERELEDADACIWYATPSLSVLIKAIVVLTQPKDDCCNTIEAEGYPLGGGSQDLSRICAYWLEDIG